jgi:uncharacterized protein (TIGR03437 family)
LVVLLASAGFLGAQQAQRIVSFSVGPDQTLSYPNSPSNPPYLVDLPDEHTTIMPPSTSGGPYLIFGAAKISGGAGGAVVLQTTDLTNFVFANALGYSRQVMSSPIPINQCNPAYTTEFDGNYAAPGSVVQDPTLPAGNFIIIYEAENHCPGGVPNQPYYATVGFARSSDGGKTWPAPINGPNGGPARHPVLQNAIPQPSTPHGPLGDAIPSALVDRTASGDYYLYVVYGSHNGTATNIPLRVARAKLGADPLDFEKWYNGSFSQPGIGGLDSPVVPNAGCTQQMADISRNDDLGLYLMIFACPDFSAKPVTAAWYYSTATSLDLEDWTQPQMIQNSRFPVTSPCAPDDTGSQFDGWYPSSMSPGAPAGHTKLSGMIFYHNGCNTGQRLFMSRTFTITAGPAPQINNGGIVIHAGTSAVVSPGSIVDIYGTNLTTTAVNEASGSALPLTLGGVQVMVNGTPAALIYVGPSQIIFQMPYETAIGAASVIVVSNNAASAPGSVTVQQAAPFILTYGPNNNRAVVVNQDGSVNASGNGAKPGDVLVAYLIGSGPLDNPIATGASAPSSPLSREKLTTTVTIGGSNATVQFAGMTPGFAGLMQANFVMPNLTPGDYPMQVTIGSAASNQPVITVSR